MAPSLSFKYYGGSNTYFNPNIWLQRPGTPQVDPGALTDPPKPTRTETTNPAPDEPYIAYGIVSNDGREPQGPMFLVFFLCPAATEPSLSDGKTMWLGEGSPNGVNGVPPRNPHLPPPDPAPRNWMIWQSNEFRYPTPSQDEHYCLVALMVIPDDSNSDTYYNRNTHKAMRDAAAKISDPIIAQRNYLEAPRKRISDSRITHVSYFNISGSPRAEGSSLALRQPDHGELVALQHMLGQRGRFIRDMTAEARAGLFDSDPSREDHDPDQDKKLQKLPLTLRIQNLEPGCVRRIYLGFELPHAETKSTTAAFVLAEQITSDGKLVGGVAVVALNGEATSLE